jgi:hypothetical protein
LKECRTHEDAVRLAEQCEGEIVSFRLNEVLGKKG